MKYRKKAVTVEAAQFIAEAKWPEGVCGCSRGYLFLPETAERTHPFPPHVHTLEGTMQIRDRDYIVKGVRGEMYPVREDIFLETYEPADG